MSVTPTRKNVNELLHRLERAANQDVFWHGSSEDMRLLSACTGWTVPLMGGTYDSDKAHRAALAIRQGPQANLCDMPSWPRSDTAHRDEPLCPKCGAEIGEATVDGIARMLSGGDGAHCEAYCACGCTYEVVKHVTVTFSTRVRG